MKKFAIPALLLVVALVAALFMHPRRGETRRSPSGDPGKR